MPPKFRMGGSYRDRGRRAAPGRQAGTATGRVVRGRYDGRMLSRGGRALSLVAVAAAALAAAAALSSMATAPRAGRAWPWRSPPCLSTPPTPSRSARRAPPVPRRPLAALGRPPLRRAVRPAGEPGRRAALRGVGLRLRVHGLALVRRERPARRPGRARGSWTSRARPGAPAARRERRREPGPGATGSRWAFEGRARVQSYAAEPAVRRPGATLPFPAGVGRVRPQRRPRDDGGRRRRAPPARLRDAAGRVEHRPGLGREAAGSGRQREYPLAVRRRLGGGAVPARPAPTRLPDGDLLVVERRFPPIGARIVRLARASLEGTGPLAPREIARFEAPAHARQLRGDRGAARRLGPDARLPALGRQRLREDARIDAVGPAAHAAAAVRPRGLRAQPASAIGSAMLAARRGAAGPGASSSRAGSWAGRRAPAPPGAGCRSAARRASSITCRS